MSADNEAAQPLNHSPEPWKVCRFPCCCGDETHISFAVHDKGQFSRHPDVDGNGVSPVAKLLHNKVVSGIVALGIGSEANARRIVACVNACKGVHTDVLEDNAHFRMAPIRRA